MLKVKLPEKLKLAQLPTPIHYLPELSKLASKFDETRIFVKRDDLTHGPAAGNKIRKLEYFLAEALKKNAKTVITCGGLQSNHARATAILARQMGLNSILLLRTQDGQGAEKADGNLLLDRLYGADVRFVTPKQYDNIEKEFFDLSQQLKKNTGHEPYSIPEGGSNAMGTWGYIDCFQEILEQLGTGGVPAEFDSIIVANGSGGTHAGLLLGKLLSDVDQKKFNVISFNVSKTAKALFEKTKESVLSAIHKNALNVPVLADEIEVIDGYVGPGYAKADESLYRFILQVSSTDGILLDPVYTGKAMQGLMGEIVKSEKHARFFGKNILFIHTGGFPSVFTFGDEINKVFR